MAEALARRGAEERGMGELEVRSAGTMASPGAPASEGAREAARQVGLDLGEHRSAAVTAGLASWADLVVCMGPSHRMDVEAAAPGTPTVLLTDFLPPDHRHRGRPVSDPVGGGATTYRETLALLREAVTGLLDDIGSG